MAIIKYKNHTSIKAIKNRMGELKSPKFSVDLSCRKEIVNEMDKLHNKKASQITDIPVNIIRSIHY